MKWDLVLIVVCCIAPSHRVTAAEPATPTSIASTADTGIPPVLLVADIQEHEQAGRWSPVSSPLFKQFSPAYRSPEQDLFGRAILTQVLETYPTYPVIILGDALDIGCESEYHRILRTLHAADRPWVIVPGNHDGFFMGVATPIDHSKKLILGGQGWDSRCRRGGRRPDFSDPQQTDRDLLWFSSANFIYSYLQTLAGVDPYPGANVATKVGNPWVSDALRQCIVGQLDSTAQVHRCVGDFGKGSGLGVYWKGASPTTDEKTDSYKKTPQAFLLQKVRLGRTTGGVPVSMVLLDTAQYEWVPRSGFSMAVTLGHSNAGTSGSILADQWAVVNEIVATREPGEILVFGGHHPLDEWSRDSRTSFANTLLALGGSQQNFYFSAHTHKGFVKRHKRLGLKEVNIGSLIDWPLSFRTLGVSERSGKLLIDAPLNEILTNDGKGQVDRSRPPATIKVVAHGTSAFPRSQPFVSAVQCDAGVFAWPDGPVMRGHAGKDTADSNVDSYRLVSDNLRVLRHTVDALAREDGMVAFPRWGNPEQGEAPVAGCGAGLATPGRNGHWYCANKERLKACFDVLLNKGPLPNADATCYSQYVLDVAVKGGREGDEERYNAMSDYISQLSLTIDLLPGQDPKALQGYKYCNAVWGSMSDCPVSGRKFSGDSDCDSSATAMFKRLDDTGFDWTLSRSKQ